MKQNYKKIIKVVMVLACAALGMTACQKAPVLNRYDAQFLSLFDTVTSVVGYAKDKETFTTYVESFKDELETYHQLFDIYNDYEGVSNIKTINDQAGIKPVEVDRKIIDLLLFSKDMYEKTDGKINVAMGSVLSIWHDYRTLGIEDSESAVLPPMEKLREAKAFTDIKQVIIDDKASTVYLQDSRMSLDVGAIAKGYAVEQVCKKLEADGFDHALISVGGNIRAIGVRGDQELWKVGIQNPDLQSDQDYLHTLGLTDESLVSSGWYQRYYTVGGNIYHHIINPDTLMPENTYQAVSILCEDSGLADALSTAVFNMDLDTGKRLLESMDGTQGMWVMPDGSKVYTSGFEERIQK